MQDCLDLGSSPSHEDCAQVGSEGYAQRAPRECRAYIGQLRRLFGEEPDGARLSIKSNPHDFGTYFSAVCYFDGDIAKGSTDDLGEDRFVVVRDGTGHPTLPRRERRGCECRPIHRSCHNSL